MYRHFVIETIQRRIIDELNRIWKEAVVSKSRYSPSICQVVLRKSTKTPRIADVPAEIQIEHHPNIQVHMVTCRPTCSVWSYSSMHFGLSTRWG
jgi:hypothetical protein